MKFLLEPSLPKLKRNLTWFGEENQPKLRMEAPPRQEGTTKRNYIRNRRNWGLIRLEFRAGEEYGVAAGMGMSLEALGWAGNELGGVDCRRKGNKKLGSPNGAVTPCFTLIRALRRLPPESSLNQQRCGSAKRLALGAAAPDPVAAKKIFFFLLITFWSKLIKL